MEVMLAFVKDDANTWQMIFLIDLIVFEVLV